MLKESDIVEGLAQIFAGRGSVAVSDLVNRAKVEAETLKLRESRRTRVESFLRDRQATLWGKYFELGQAGAFEAATEWLLGVWEELETPEMISLEEAFPEPVGATLPALTRTPGCFSGPIQDPGYR